MNPRVPSPTCNCRYRALIFLSSSRAPSPLFALVERTDLNCHRIIRSVSSHVNDKFFRPKKNSSEQAIPAIAAASDSPVSKRGIMPLGIPAQALDYPPTGVVNWGSESCSCYWGVVSGEFSIKFDWSWLLTSLQDGQPLRLAKGVPP